MNLLDHYEGHHKLETCDYFVLMMSKAILHSDFHRKNALHRKQEADFSQEQKRQKMQKMQKRCDYSVSEETKSQCFDWNPSNSSNSLKPPGMWNPSNSSKSLKPPGMHFLKK